MDPWEQGQDFFAQGKLAMVAGGFEGLNKLEHAGIDYGVAGLPTPEGVEPFFNVWSDGMAIFASSEHQEAAKELVTFLATDGQRIRADQGDFPLDSTVAQETGWTKGIEGREEGVELLQHARGAIFIRTAGTRTGRSSTRSATSPRGTRPPNRPWMTPPPRSTRTSRRPGGSGTLL